MISTLRLQQYRSYYDDSFEFSDGVNIVVGPNASGKTNLLESVLVLARGASYRVSDADLVAFEQPWARIDARMHDDTSRVVKIITQPRPSKVFDINGKPLKRLLANHKMPVVLFEPNHLQLLSGSPEARRNYLDDLLEQTVPEYGRLRNYYTRTLRQRNTLLKRGPSSSDQLFAWNIRLSELAAKIVRGRMSLLTEIRAILPDLYTELSHSETSVDITYNTAFSVDQYESQLLKQLEDDLQIDLLRGYTRSGPHRDDFIVTYNARKAADTASRGEIRTAVLALKVFELQYISKTHDTRPLLLLDDVFSELDGSRRRLLTNYIHDYQTFITTTDADIVTQNFSQACNVIAITPRDQGLQAD